MNRYSIGALVTVAAASAFLSSGGARTLVNASLKVMSPDRTVNPETVAPKPAGQMRR